MTQSKPKSDPEREQLKVARRLAASAEKRGVIAEWLERRAAMQQSRGGELVLPDHTADVAELQARLRARALTMCEDIMLHSVSERHQLRAIELVLMMDAPAAEKREPARVVATLAPDQVDKVREALALRRQLTRKAGGE